MLQALLLENGEKILKALIDRAKKGDRTALALCVERLIPRLKDMEELPLDEQQADMENPEFARLVYKEFTTDEIHLLLRMANRIEALKAKSDDPRAPAPKAAQDGPAVPGGGSAPA